MTDAVGDTGPFLHLSQIGWTTALNVFSAITIPEAVLRELLRFGLNPTTMGLQVGVRSVCISESDRENALSGLGGSVIHAADAEVFALAQRNGFREVVFSDDLALRQVLESRGADVVGTVGILVRGYHKGILSRTDLVAATDGLFSRSSLHMSPGFRAFVRGLINDIG